MSSVAELCVEVGIESCPVAQRKEGERRAWQAAHQTRRDGESTFSRFRKGCQVEEGC